VDATGVLARPYTKCRSYRFYLKELRHIAEFLISALQPNHESASALFRKDSAAAPYQVTPRRLRKVGMRAASGFRNDSINAAEKRSDLWL